MTAYNLGQTDFSDLRRKKEQMPLQLICFVHVSTCLDGCFIVVCLFTVPSDMAVQV